MANKIKYDAIDLLTEKEDDLPDHLVSPLEKKKRDARFFEKINYIIMLESIKIHQIFISFMLHEKEKFELEHALFSENLSHLLKTIKFIVQKNNLSMHLSERLYFKLQKVEYKFKQILTHLNVQIIKLQQLLNQQTLKIKTLEENIQLARSNIAKVWINYFISQFSDPDFQEKGLLLTLPNHLNQILEKNNIEIDHIPLTQSIFLKIGHAIEKKLFSNNFNLADIPNLIKNHLEKYIKDYLETELGFIEQSDKEKIISHVLKDTNTSNQFTQYIIQQLANDKNFMHEINYACEQEKFIVEEKLKWDVSNQYLNDVTKVEFFVKDKLEQINDIMQTSLDHPSTESNMNVNKEMDLELDDYLAMNDALLIEIDSIFKNLDADLAAINSADTSANELLTNLYQLNDPAWGTTNEDWLVGFLENFHQKTETVLGISSEISTEITEENFPEDMTKATTEVIFRK